MSADAITVNHKVPELKTYLEGLYKVNIPTGSFDNIHTIEIPYKLHKSYKGAVLLKSKNDCDDPLDLPPQQLKNLVRGVVWRDEHFHGMSIKTIVEREGISKASVGQIILRSFDTPMAM